VARLVVWYRQSRTSFLLLHCANDMDCDGQGSLSTAEETSFSALVQCLGDPLVLLRPFHCGTYVAALFRLVNHAARKRPPYAIPMTFLEPVVSGCLHDTVSFHKHPDLVRYVFSRILHTAPIDVVARFYTLHSRNWTDLADRLSTFDADRLRLVLESYHGE
jgi:hypothetical protein